MKATSFEQWLGANVDRLTDDFAEAKLRDAALTWEAFVSARWKAEQNQPTRFSNPHEGD